MKKILSILLVSSALPAFADSQAGGFSGEVMLGLADQETKVQGAKSSGDDTSLGFRLSYSVTENVLLELGYSQYGEAENNYVDSFGDSISETMESSAFKAGVAAYAPLNDDFGLLARVGLSKWDYDFEATDSSAPGQVFKADDSGTDFYYGVGMRFNLNEKVFSSIDYTITKMDMEYQGVSVDHEVKNLSVSIGTRF
ncbi:porin family protein [Spongiibacter sp. KMU-158]|uniref:Porin family protein n=1 Tax=Spongiibacter pelagi TaxID=2760804 RepID=A0A927GXL4_9GAMM|nr:porin family protein [Spongiibacter pelagi]MBD2859549.1 porin family protein [Spongiibacter pelagi]